MSSSQHVFCPLVPCSPCSGRASLLDIVHTDGPVISGSLVFARLRFSAAARLDLDLQGAALVLFRTTKLLATKCLLLRCVL